MNTLNIYPRKIKEAYTREILNSGILESPEKYHNIRFMISVAITVLAFFIFFLFSINLLFTLLVFIVMNLIFYFSASLKASTRIKKMETAFPDVLSLMASNLRSGITIDRAFLLAARPEFDPLDKEILKTGKEIATGKDVLEALKFMAKKIDSEKISKVVMLIISGIRAGGKISDLLEETARNMKEKEMLEKKTASTILMYVIFIFFAVGIGAPILFGLSSILVEVIVRLSSQVPDASTVQMSLPISFGKVSISSTFIIYFSVIFITVSDLIACLLIGLVNKGEGKAGLRLFFPLIALSLGIFFAIRIFLSKVLFDLIKGF